MNSIYIFNIFLEKNSLNTHTHTHTHTNQQQKNKKSKKKAFKKKDTSSSSSIATSTINKSLLLIVLVLVAIRLSWGLIETTVNKQVDGMSIKASHLILNKILRFHRGRLTI